MGNGNRAYVIKKTAVIFLWDQRNYCQFPSYEEQFALIDRL